MDANRILDDLALDTLFRTARTHKAWQGRDISDVLIRSVYELMKWGPTSGNSCPARFVFVKSKEAKDRLRPHLDKGNVDKVMSASATVIIAHDLKFYEKFPLLAPHMKDPIQKFEGKDQENKETAFRNGSLQGAYFILSARALGLDCGPMSGFDKEGVKKEFLSGTSWEPNFLCNIGYGDTEKLFPRAPRLEFDEVCEII